MDPWAALFWAANDEWKLGDCGLFLQAMVGCCSPWPLPSLVDAGVWVEGCVSVGRSFLLDHYDLYFNAYYCFRVIFIHLAPCCALVVLNALLGRTSCYSTASQRTHRARPLANKVKDFDCGQLWAYPPESAPSRGESRPPSSLGPHSQILQILYQNGTSISSSVFARVVFVTDRQTAHTTLVTIGYESYATRVRRHCR